MSEHVTKHYPNAVSFDHFFSMIDDQLRGAGFSPAHAVIGIKQCRDDCNYTLRQYIFERYGTPGYFSLEVLAGLPSPGKTAYAALAHHLKDAAGQGPLILLDFAHIGFDPTGTLGKVARHGRKNPGANCGALVGYVHAMMKESYTIDDAFPADKDPEMNKLARLLEPYEQDIKTAGTKSFEEALKAATIKAWEISRKIQLGDILSVKGELHGHPVILAGGIHVNTSPPEQEDLIVPFGEIVLLHE